jgi:hypothetical protein
MGWWLMEKMDVASWFAMRKWWSPVLLSHVHDINFYHLLGNWHHLLLEDYLDTIFILDTLVFVSACSNLLVKLTRHWCILLPWCIKEKMKKRLNPYASASVYRLVLCLFLLQFNYLFFQKIPSQKCLNDLCSDKRKIKFACQRTHFTFEHESARSRIYNTRMNQNLSLPSRRLHVIVWYKWKIQADKTIRNCSIITFESTKSTIIERDLKWCI